MGKLGWTLSIIATLALIGTVIGWNSKDHWLPLLSSESSSQPSEPVPAPEPEPEEASFEIVAAPEPAEQPNEPEISIPEPIPPPEPAALKVDERTLSQRLSEEVGAKTFETLFQSDRLIRRLVVSLDNLDKAPIPLRYRPLNGPSGSFATKGVGSDISLSPANFRRYEKYLKLTESVPPSRLAELFLEMESKFDQAYADLGYPDQPFKQRLLAVTDHLLSTPSPKAPIALKQPKVFYEFADDELEALSSGQKLLLRIGPENRGRIENYLRSFREKIS